ncbi:MAG: hypothetical protein M3O20_17745 [Acidobacteriota bacterium]|nr:hypothetical protein [Acidobacteriota bacterium]
MILYGVDSLSDCLHGDEYKVGKNYLIYAEEGEVGKFVWYGLTGVVPEGTKILVPESCAPDGETSEDRKGLDHALGKGRIPQKIE